MKCGIAGSWVDVVEEPEPEPEGEVVAPWIAFSSNDNEMPKEGTS